MLMVPVGVAVRQADMGPFCAMVFSAPPVRSWGWQAFKNILIFGWLGKT
jgi:hypothetical protein